MSLLALFKGIAAHYDGLFFLIFLGIAAFFRILSKARQPDPDSDEETLPPGTPPQPLAQRDVEDSDQERIRRFLEALGQAPGASPPPPVRPRPVQTSPPVVQESERARTIRPRRDFLNPLPPLTTAPPPLPKPVPLERTITRVPYEIRPFVPPPAEAPLFEVQKGEEPTTIDTPRPIATSSDAYDIVTASPPVIGKASDLFADLRTPYALRRAILLREILGPPRALAPLEL